MSTDSQLRSDPDSPLPGAGQDVLQPAETSTPAETGAPTEAPPRWGALFVVLAGVFATSLDFFVVNVAIPSTQHDLHASPAQVQFFMAGFGLAAASGVITGGRLGDIFGRRRMFAIGLALFTVASAACGVAQNPGELITGRVIQGLGTALLTPQALTIVSTAYSGAHRAKAFVWYGLTIGFAGVFGQLIGGGLIAANIAGLGWRVIFLVNIPIGAVALAYTRRLVPETKGDGSTKLDLIGAVLITAGMVAVVLPLIEGRQQGWPAWVYVSFAAALVLIGVFVLYQHRLAKRGGTPLMSLELFRERAFSVGLVTALAWTSAMASFFLVLALYLQNGRSLSPLNSGLIFLPLGVGFFGSSTVAPKLGAKMGHQLLAAGALVVAVGYVVLAQTSNHIGTSGAIEWLIPGLLISGWGMGMVLAPLPATVLAGVTPRHAAAASGVLTTIQEVGNALGVALVGVVFFAALGHGGGSGAGAATSAYPHAFAEGLYLLAGFAVLVALLVQALPKAPQQA